MYRCVLCSKHFLACYGNNNLKIVRGTRLSKCYVLVKMKNVRNRAYDLVPRYFPKHKLVKLW